MIKGKKKKMKQIEGRYVILQMFGIIERIFKIKEVIFNNEVEINGYTIPKEHKIIGASKNKKGKIVLISKNQRNDLYLRDVQEDSFEKLFFSFIVFFKGQMIKDLVDEMLEKDKKVFNLGKIMKVKPERLSPKFEIRYYYINKIVLTDNNELICKEKSGGTVPLIEISLDLFFNIFEIIAQVSDKIKEKYFTANIEI